MFDVSLYAITDKTWLGNNTIYEQVEKALKGGITMLQLRDKSASYDELKEEAILLKELCDRYRIPLIINDNVELAKEIDCAGVHVGQKDMDVSKAREILGENKIIGVSARNAAQAIEAMEHGASYIGSGAVFGTNTKNDASKLELEVLKEICNSVNIPVVAIGGINKDNIELLNGSGVSGVAIISGIFASEDIEQSTICLKELIKMCF